MQQQQAMWQGQQQQQQQHMMAPPQGSTVYREMQLCIQVSPDMMCMTTVSTTSTAMASTQGHHAQHRAEQGHYVLPLDGRRWCTEPRQEGNYSVLWCCACDCAIQMLLTYTLKAKDTKSTKGTVTGTAHRHIKRRCCLASNNHQSFAIWIGILSHDSRASSQFHTVSHSFTQFHTASHNMGHDPDQQTQQDTVNRVQQNG